jgi:hypothetical protein
MKEREKLENFGKEINPPRFVLNFALPKGVQWRSRLG